MKQKKETFIGFSYYASYFINNDSSGLEPAEKIAADAIISAMQSDYGPSARIVGCGNETFFGIPNYGLKNKGDCITYFILYCPLETVATWKYYYKHYMPGNDDPADGYWTLKSGLTFPTRENLLPWQARGLMYTATGYGKKIPTTKQLFILGRWRRVYCSIFSNSGICYVVADGVNVNVDDCNMQ